MNAQKRKSISSVLGQNRRMKEAAENTVDRGTTGD